MDPTVDTDSVDYWKKQAKHYEQKFNDLQQELDDYTENSAQLEKELEASLLQVEKQNRDLDNQNQRLKNEIELLKKKLERSQHETNALESELQALKIEKDKQAAYIREIEQANDDLERGQRVVSETVSYIEAMLHREYERNAVLENEIDEVETLRVKLQRATDEARDLKQELKVMEKLPQKKEDDSTGENGLVNGHLSSSSRAHVETETQTVLSAPQKREINGNGMTPSTRVMAINIVGDLLRKVGLERFLCPHCGKIKCPCDAQPTATNNPTSDEVHTQQSDSGDNNVDQGCDKIEYRRQKSTHQLSGTDNGILQSPNVAQRSSEQPFVRAVPGENGKLRRSFAVRSREGLEHLFGLNSVKRNQDQMKQRPTLRQ